jgi:hypothetical protein
MAEGEEKNRFIFVLRPADVFNKSSPEMQANDVNVYPSAMADVKKPYRVHEFFSLYTDDTSKSNICEN